MTDLPSAASPYRVARSRIDDNYDRGQPLPYVQVGAAEVVDVGPDGEVCTVDFGQGDDPVGGVVVLGDPPEIGDWTEVHARGDLLTTPDTSETVTEVIDTGGDEGGLPPGGTTDQVLTKASSVDYDAYWDTPTEGGGGGAIVYVQPDEPPDVAIGTLWFDTDEIL